jgi:hypothetical protein
MRNGNPEDRSVPVPLLTLEEFFEGNDAAGSIGCNLEAEPVPAEFYDLLRAIRQRPSVSDVRVQITCVDDPGNEWPFSDTVWILTDESLDEVREWFPAGLAPDEVWEGWHPNQQYEACQIVPGHRPVAVWYD